MTLSAAIAGVAVWGPGLEGWAAARAVLRGEIPRADTEQPIPPPTILPANERRRSGTVIRLALAVAQEATAMAGIAPDTLRCVFGSANGDSNVVHAILTTLAAPPGNTGPPQVSPTQFHNSVHNAPLGYWSIATGSRQAATTLGCSDATFAAALLKAMAEIACEGAPVLLCLYDAPLPPPIALQRPTSCNFAAALVLTPGDDIRVGFDPSPATPDTWEPRDPTLQTLARINPAARTLRLLQALARGAADDFAAELLDGRVNITLRPCSSIPTS